MITDIIVLTALVLGAAFSLAWLARRDVRERIERPKHRFLERLERYDRDCRRHRNSAP
jgi:hypothetical protein